MQVSLQPLKRVYAIAAGALHSTPPKPVAKSGDAPKPSTDKEG